MKACGRSVVAAGGGRRPRRFVFLVVFLGRRLAPVPAAHLLAQIGRLRVDRRQRIDGAERGRQPGQPAAVEAALEQLRRLLRATAAGIGAEHDGDQPAAVARGGGHHVVAGGADEAGLHAVGAGIAVEQRIVIVHHPVAVADRMDVPIEIVFGKFLDQRARQNAEVARRGDVVLRRQSVRVDEIALRHAEPAGIGVHHVGEALDRAADALGDGHRHVVGRFDHQHLHRVVDGDGGADLEAHLGRLLRGRVARYREQRVEADAAFLDGAQRRVGGHQFGDGGRIPRIGGVFRVQHLAGRGLDQQLAPRLARRRRRRAPAPPTAARPISRELRLAASRARVRGPVLALGLGNGRVP